MTTLTDRNQPWRQTARAAIPPRQRLAIPRVTMPETPPALRVAHPELEVNRGLTPQQATLEATRCLDCPNPACIPGCPVNIDIPGFIKEIERGNLPVAAAILR
ncbi:MAG: bifunctional dihydroorotate dehydrogenase B NAD binding subunit/NADPH-dependent glutamate synthase, partial [Odoribacteraceae bacterium]|nr:bifunctional dihydroorotate dehydrogenase B NAD binding subunit/NADPH-dependent glutamate synthase [Odoribacteraceae bacterium]